MSFGFIFGSILNFIFPCNILIMLFLLLHLLPDDLHVYILSLSKYARRKESIKLINMSVTSWKLCTLGSISSPINLIET